MQFVFKRDEEGRERIYVGDVCVATLVVGTNGAGGNPTGEVPCVKEQHIADAVERADEAGFWSKKLCGLVAMQLRWSRNEVAVDVPVADNAVLSVTVGDDES